MMFFLFRVFFVCLVCFVVVFLCTWVDSLASFRKRNHETH